MCGIIAFTGQRAAAPVLLDGLRRLKYRGYDSSGIAVLSRKRLKHWKAAGKLEALEHLLPKTITGNSGIGHTRWATHGAPTDINAHPHLDEEQRLAIVHNGIIENASQLRSSLINDGVVFQSETDTEVLAHLFSRAKGSLLEAVRTVLLTVQGTYGLAVLDRNAPGAIVVARNGSPLILGIGDGETLAASDMSALSRHTREVVHLDDGEVAMLTPTGFAVSKLDASPTSKDSMTLSNTMQHYDRGGHTHYLHREISDQPETVRQTLTGRLDYRFSTAHLGGLNLKPRDLLNMTRIHILGCGSAYYAGLSGAHMIESLARLPVVAEPAAEFRYRNPVIERDTLYIAVSQSGETFDTLAALREVQRKGGFVLGIVNSIGSTIAREVDGGIYMHAGPEVSVASTKAYTSTLTVFALLAVMIGRLRDVSPQLGARLLQTLDVLPEQITSVLTLEKNIAELARLFATAHSAFFLGRTAGYPIALEGAQKLKEVSYVHAEAYPASELKHGPLALVTADTPCVIVLPDTELLDKSLSSLEEIKARSAPVIAVTDASDPRIDKLADHVIRLPHSNPLTQPIVMGVALQLLAYHVALLLGRDVDQPRNLAKSVTVE
ncbi:MAG: glutamine--fructose-6-phosphate transaminase (isomerizing) [Granulosicoccus sp.]